MPHALAIIATAAGVFIGSNVDDLIVLIVLFLSARAGKLPVSRIVAGQYLGYGILVAGSIVIALGLAAVPQRWVGLVGFVPLTLGLWGLVGAVRNGPEHQPILARRLWAIAALTVANGSDDLSVYAPLLRTNTVADDVLIVLVLLISVALLCAIAWWLGTRRRVIKTLKHFGHWVVPLVFIAIGVLVIVDSGLFH
ncbi:MAG TPA: cadmium resistance transporter [Pseudonocardiaceae bacterium]